MQLTKQVGEYLVSAELSRLGFITTPFAGNVPEFDILATDEKLETKPVQVKTIRGGSWQFDGSKFLDISISVGDRESIRQRINGKKHLENPNLVCILVKLVSRGQDEFYVLRLGDLQEIIFEGYSRWLEQHGGRRPRKPKSTHNSISPRDLLKYRDNWELLR